jgi:hypothetical protein
MKYSWALFFVSIDYLIGKWERKDDGINFNIKETFIRIENQWFFAAYFPEYDNSKSQSIVGMFCGVLFKWLTIPWKFLFSCELPSTPIP